MAELLIDAYLADLRSTGQYAARTVESYEYSLRLAERDLSATAQGLAVACEYELKLWLYDDEPWPHRDEWAPATRALRHAALCSFFAWATRADRQVLDFNPMVALPRPKVPAGLPRPPSDERLRQLLAGCRDPFRTWALMAAYQGMRCCEIAACDREDIQSPPGETFIRGKGAKQRYVPTHELVWRAVRHLPPGPLARRANGARCTARHVSALANQYFDRIGLPEIGMHKLRHWYGSRTLDGCHNLRTVQELMGHASPTSTAIYTLVTSAARRAAVDTLPRLGVP